MWKLNFLLAPSHWLKFHLIHSFSFLPVLLSLFTSSVLCSRSLFRYKKSRRNNQIMNLLFFSSSFLLHFHSSFVSIPLASMFFLCVTCRPSQISLPPLHCHLAPFILSSLSFFLILISASLTFTWWTCTFVVPHSFSNFLSFSLHSTYHLNYECTCTWTCSFYWGEEKMKMILPFVPLFPVCPLTTVYLLFFLLSLCVRVYGQVPMVLRFEIICK